MPPKDTRAQHWKCCTQDTPTLLCHSPLCWLEALLRCIESCQADACAEFIHSKQVEAEFLVRHLFKIALYSGWMATSKDLPAATFGTQLEMKWLGCKILVLLDTAFYGIGADVDG